MRIALATLSTAVLLAGGMGSGGCATAGHTDIAAAPGGESMLHVANHNWLDARIYLVVSGTRMRIGTVMGAAGREVITLPPYPLYSSGAVLVVELIGSAAQYVSPRLVVGPGQVVELAIENNLALSTVAVW